jgi:serine/threonine-protein kinase
MAVLGVLVWVVIQAAAARTPTTELITVPEVAGMSQREALDLLQASGFNVTTDERTSETVPALVAITTDPAPGSQRPRDSTVTLIVSRGPPEFPVPTLIGQTLEAARELLAESGLAEGSVTDRPDAEAPPGVVLDQAPDPGLQVAAGTLVDLVVSSGPEVIVLPDLTNMEERDALTTLNRLGLVFETQDEPSTEIAEGIVIRTEPAAGSEVAAGDTIILFISSGLPPVQVPNLFLSTAAAATTILQDFGLVINVSQATINTNDPAQDGLVLSQQPAAGATVPRGSIVTVTLGKFTGTTTTTPG